MSKLSIPVLAFVLLATSTGIPAADRPLRMIRDGVLKDFTESRYNEPGLLFLQDSCVARDYTIELSGSIVVLRQTTCHPSTTRAIVNEIGAKVTTIESTDPKQMGVLDARAKPIWLRIFKVALKPPPQGQTELNNLADRQRTEGPPKTVAESQAQLTITSEPTGAEIEINGEFIGNTPSTVTVKEGNVTVTVKKAGYQPWQRSLKVNVADKRTLQAEMVK